MYNIYIHVDTSEFVSVGFSWIRRFSCVTNYKTVPLIVKTFPELFPYVSLMSFPYLSLVLQTDKLTYTRKQHYIVR